MKPLLRLLQIEDNESDAAMIVRTLERSGYDVRATRVETGEAMRAALGGGAFDLIISDYHMPQFDAPGALKIAQQSALDLPFIIVSGTIGEDIAVQMMRAGAQDYLMKNGLARLGPAVARELNEAKHRRERRVAEQMVKSSEERLRLALAATHQGLFDLDLQTGEATVNHAYAEMLGYDYAVFRESHADLLARMHPDERHAVETAYHDYLDGRIAEYRIEFRQLTTSGAWIWVLCVGAVVARDADGTPLRMVGTHLNITERKQAEEALQLAAMVYEHSSEAMMICDADNNIIAINAAFTQVTGYEADEVIGRNPRLLSSGRHDSSFYASMWDQLARTGQWQGELWNMRKDGALFAESLIVNTIRNADGSVLRYVAQFNDITEKKESETLIWQQANFDVLTNLPNRRMYRDRLQLDIKKSRREHTPLAILFIDLDHFKEVNDTLGHDKGDLLLVEAARRIRACVRDCDTVARMGGDEFTITLADLVDPGCIEDIAQDVIATLAAPFHLGQEQVFVSASIGITLYPNDATEIDELFKHADQALYVAKGGGRNRYSYFTPALQIAAQARMRLSNDLRGALADHQFRLYFQPIVHMATGRIRKAEALIRWQHPQRGLVSPAEFIPLAESTGLIVNLGEWVFKEAARFAKNWRLDEDDQFQISINQSPLEFQRRGVSQAHRLAYLQELALSGTALVVEITESLLLDATDSST
jgi:diguanylate cyclase (GGDEF)-like protein/PAS domain S-box-containing protein